MHWLRELFWLSATYNFRITARYIHTASNTMADAIRHLHDPVYCEHFLRSLLSRPLISQSRVTPHLSRNTFDAFPPQVRSMLRSGNLQSWGNTADTPLHSLPPLLTNHSYVPIFVFVSTLVTGQSLVPLIIYSAMWSSWPGLSPLLASHVISMSCASFTYSVAFPTLCKNHYLNSKRTTHARYKTAE